MPERCTREGILVPQLLGSQTTQLCAFVSLLFNATVTCLCVDMRIWVFVFGWDNVVMSIFPIACLYLKARVPPLHSLVIYRLCKICVLYLSTSDVSLCIYLCISGICSRISFFGDCVFLAIYLGALCFISVCICVSAFGRPLSGASLSSDSHLCSGPLH